MAQAVDRSRFFRNAIRFSLFGQIPPGILLYRLLSLSGVPLPALVLLVLLVWLNLGLFHYVQHAFPEKPMRPAWKYGVVMPFFVYYFAAGMVLAPAVLLVLAYGVVLIPIGTGAWDTMGAGEVQVSLASMGWMAPLDRLSAVLWGGALLISFYACLIRRPWVKINRLEVAIPGLPAAFDGFRIAQLSDLHVGNFVGPRRLARWVDMANREEADLVAVTGDLVNSGDHFIPVLAGGLNRLRAKEAVVISMGNHDYWAGDEQMPRSLQRAGLTVMRNEGRVIRRGDAELYLAAVDDTWSRRADLERALSRRPAGAPVVLLSHDPMMFPAAVSRGVGLTLAGHTHGGQLAVPFYERLNLSSRVYTYTVGLYEAEGCSLYVHRGMGTTGPPVRIGAPPELAVITLRRG